MEGAICQSYDTWMPSVGCVGGSFTMGSDIPSTATFRLAVVLLLPPAIANNGTWVAGWSSVGASFAP